MRRLFLFALVLCACDPIELDVRETDAEVLPMPPPNDCELAGRTCFPEDEPARLCPDGTRPFDESCGELAPALCCAIRVLSDCELRLGECVSSAFGGQCPADYEKSTESCDVSGRPPGDTCCTRIAPSPCEVEGHFCISDSGSGMCPPGYQTEAAICFPNPDARICCSM